MKNSVMNITHILKRLLVATIKKLQPVFILFGGCAILILAMLKSNEPIYSEFFQLFKEKTQQLQKKCSSDKDACKPNTQKNTQV